MKYKLAFLAFLFLSVSTLFGQNEQIKSYDLNWKGIENCLISSSLIPVISFEGALYPNESHLPYFTQRIPCEPKFSYRPELKNPVYLPLTADEAALLPKGISLPSEVKPVLSRLTERGSVFLSVSICPFVDQNGKIFKLKSFDLQVAKEDKPLKTISSVSHTYANSSILASGKFVKIKVIDSGVYKLTYEDLVSMGIDPANVHVFGYGGNVLDQDFTLPKIDDLPEQAIHMNKGSDGIFNAGDYILFYAQGVNKWRYDSAKSMFTHVTNSYSKYGYYFVSSDAGVGRSIEVGSVEAPNGSVVNPVTEFIDYGVYEKDVVNLAFSGKEFYQPFGDATSLNFSFTAPNTVSASSVKVRLDVAASSTLASTFSLSLNSGQVNMLSLRARTGDNYEQGVGGTGIFNYPVSGDALNFILSYPKPTSTSLGYLNFLEFNVRRKLKMSGSVMQFQNIDYLGQSAFSRYELSNVSSNVEIWDITDPQNISKVSATITNGVLTFTASSNEPRSYLAIDPTASNTYAKPEVVGVASSQNLHAISRADMVIITHPDFLSQAQKLAQAHRDKDGLVVEVVSTEQVYNEFSSGTPDATAYRWMMKMLYDRAASSKGTIAAPKYLLLFGRGSYDNRKIISNSGDNLVLTYQSDNSLITTSSYVTDDYFALLDNTEGIDLAAGLMDIGVGRFPVTTAQQATDVVDKTISYMNNEGKGSWKNQLCFLADDGGNGDGNVHMSQADEVASSVAAMFPAYQVNKIYLDAFQQQTSASGESYPRAKTKFLNMLNSGLFFLNFTGHAGPTGWTNESILSLADVKALSNQHLPLFVAVTCDFSQFDVQAVSGGEQVLLNPIGGGIGILSATRPVYSYENFILDKLICTNLFQKKNGVEMCIGDIVASAKNQITSGSINKLAYIYMGDPALRLNYPTKYQVSTTKINGDSVLNADTLRALSVDTVVGFIAGENGKIATDFNGILQVVVYDKTQKITTLNNHNETNGTLIYNDRPNVLFAGKTEVKNGKYSFTFMLPKDIRYNYGGGRINYYAQDDSEGYEAQGYYEDFVIGGTEKNTLDDSEGPMVKLYLNSKHFVSGDKVDDKALFVAELSDINGINTVGSGIGHDILLTIDQSSDSSYVLNDFFQANTNSYTDGIVSYKLPSMSNAKHSLTFRVWDLLNNSTTQTLYFQVEKGLSPQIYSISCQPNPVKDWAKIVVSHDRPETVLKIGVEVFDIAGRKIWSFSQSSVGDVNWDLMGNNGQKVKSGLYLYRVAIQTTNAEISSKTNKMIIVE